MVDVSIWLVSTKQSGFKYSLYQKFQFKKSFHFRRLKFFNKDSEICCFLLHTRSNRVSMALCKYSTFVGGTCGASSENPANVECVTIGQCTRDLHGHLKLLKISDDPGVDSESKLLLMQAGMQARSVLYANTHVRT